MDGELPDLKKRKQERQGSGLALGGAKAAADPFSGALGGTAAGAAAAAKSGAAAALARPLATVGGRLALTALLAGLLAGALALAHRLLFGAAQSATGFTQADLGELKSSVRVRKPRRSKALDYLALAYKHEFTMPEDQPAFKFKRSAPAPAGEAPGAAGPGPTPDPEAGKTDWARALSQAAPGRIRFERGSGGSPATRLGASSGARFENADLFKDDRAPRFGEGFDRGKLALLPAPAGPGKAPAPKAADAASARGATVRSVRVRSDRAMGQLKAAKALSDVALGGLSDESARTLVTNAFDGKQAEGGPAPLGPAGADGMPPENAAVRPLGEGAPPPEAGHSNATEYQAQLQQALGMGAQAGQMKKESWLLLAAAFTMMALAAALLAIPEVRSYARSLMACGSMMMGMSLLLGSMAGRLAAQAKLIGGAIHRQYGQEAQGNIVEECMDQAIEKGARPEDCRPKTQGPSLESAAKAASLAEMAAAYTIDGGGGDPAIEVTPPSAPGTPGPAPSPPGR